MTQGRATKSNVAKKASGRNGNTLNKKSTARKNTTSRNNKKTKNKNNTQKRQSIFSSLDPDIKYEVVVIAFFALSIFLIISIYFGQGGFVGDFFRQLFFGLMGIGAYLLPIYLFLSAFIKIFNKDNDKLNNKIILVFFFIMSVATIAHIWLSDTSQILYQLNDRKAFFPALVNYFSLSAKHQLAGGLIGGLIGDLFVFMLDKTGSIVIIIAIMIALGIMLFEKSFIQVFRIIKNLVVKAYTGIKATIINGKKNRMHKKAENVDSKASSFDTSEDPAFMDQQLNNQKVNKRKKGSFLSKSKVVEMADYLKTGEKEKEKIAVNDTDNTTIGNQTPENNEQELINNTLVIENKDNATESMQISFFKDSEKKKNQKVSNEDTASDISSEINSVKEQSEYKENYKYPPIELLKDIVDNGSLGSTEQVKNNARKLESTLESFGVGARVVNVSCGPTVTRYEIQPDVGVKVSKIVNLTDDIALNLAASGIRMEAPIPGKSLIGIEVPNKDVKSVYIREVIDSEAFMSHSSKIAFAVGKDISGETIIADIAYMPHMMISGATGAGKSVCINTLITSILFRAHPDEVKLVMIDPKVVELKIYNGIPHLLIPVVTDSKKAAGALYWAVQEMEERYQLFAASNARDLKGYNKLVEEKGEGKKLPQIVIIVDELADLMQVAAKDVEDAICRLAQKARAAGIHLILATQRPSVDVITGLIKANIPSRIAFAVSSGTDSRTIIDMNGAEKLIGKGDMLYYPRGMAKPLRVQGAFISDREVENIVEFLKESEKVTYDSAIIEQIDKADRKGSTDQGNNILDERDDYFEQALELVVDKQKASASMIQRRFRVGYNRAARIVDQLFEAGYIGDEEGSKPRQVLLTPEAYYQMKHNLADGQATSEEAATTEGSSNEENYVSNESGI